ncbi:hypothetical protein F2Q70_00020745 [Brassica cretica]|uniref:Pentatricopeptide repeat-containing protein n=1 Tax=Brassica cretica TaxID=69181 RepID=A0A8S9GS50_BRACR|nr:hypothetical protein F2Q70_00020745 [Brassica cretica]KAF2566489.1 hypothetical protein F2Q68_00024228 [Brassica cretica]
MSQVKSAKVVSFGWFFLKCVNAGNTNAICYEGLHAATGLGLEKSIKILEPNVPTHGLSTFIVAIFNVCLGRDKEASEVFQLFAAHHADLRSEAVLAMGESYSGCCQHSMRCGLTHTMKPSNFPTMM